MRSYWTRVAPNAMTGPYEKRRGHTGTHTGQALTSMSNSTSPGSRTRLGSEQGFARGSFRGNSRKQWNALIMKLRLASELKTQGKENKTIIFLKVMTTDK